MDSLEDNTTSGSIGIQPGQDSPSAGGDNLGPNPQQSSGTMQALLASRIVKMYGITEEEISSISSNTTRRTIWFSVCAMMFSFASAIWLGVQIEGKGKFAEMSPQIQVLYNYGVPLAIILGLIFLVIGSLSLWDTGKTINRIKSESKWERGDI